ncbi:MAG: hypothetical protein ACXVIG_04455 [Halobacteriota archaeon]
MLLADSTIVRQRQTPCQLLKTYVLPVAEDTYEMARELARWQNATVDELIADMVADLHETVFGSRRGGHGKPHGGYCELATASD